MSEDAVVTGVTPPDEGPTLAAGLREIAPDLPSRLEADTDDVDGGLARLVLTLIEFIRQVLEHQAVRRMEGGTLSDDEIERVGLALMRLEDRLAEVRVAFGLDADELNLDLGPLGRLVR